MAPDADGVLATTRRFQTRGRIKHSAIERRQQIGGDVLFHGWSMAASGAVHEGRDGPQELARGPAPGTGSPI